MSDGVSEDLPEGLVSVRILLGRQRCSYKYKLLIEYGW